MTVKEFVNQYNDIFAEDGSVKECGRLKCIKMIVMSGDITNKPATEFGDVSTGFMNVEAIQKLKNQLVSIGKRK